MISIRKNTFETNSSSTHSIAIPSEVQSLDDALWHNNFYHVELGEFGWEFGSANPIDYLYTALCYFDDKEKLKYFKNFIKKNCSAEVKSELEFDQPHYKRYKLEDNTYHRYLEYGYIDHVEESADLIKDLFSDDSLLLKYLTGAHIMTGNDNATEDEVDILKNFENKYKEKSYKIYRKGN